MFAPSIIAMIKYDDEGTSSWAPSILYSLQQHPQVLAEICPQLMDLFFETEDMQFISKLF